MICDSIVEPITRRVEKENKSLDDIAKEICPKVTYGREKIIRIIRDFIGEGYLIEHAEILGYDVGKAELAKKRKTRSHKKIDATTDTVVESKSVTPIASCQAVNTEHKETGQTKGHEQVIEEHDKPATCCQERTVRTKIVLEDSDSEEEMQDEVQEIALERNVPNDLVEAIKKLIRLFSLEDVKNALELAESEA